jgi:large subunit ribosomal protein L22
MVGYSMEADGENTARAIGAELPISWKDSVELCRELRGLYLADAKEFLASVVNLERPIHLRRYCRHAAHKRGKGFGPGKFPVKAAGSILRVLEGVENNAEYKGLDPESMFIIHIAANRGTVYPGWKPRARGRSSPWNHETVNVEIIIQETEE